MSNLFFIFQTDVLKSSQTLLEEKTILPDTQNTQYTQDNLGQFVFENS